ncbi:alpha/beta fold hydrolase [Nocardioides houyundeii]|uniref:alpha/beta fold hydrolase n=1 Tax=Nocardioides houyundeii TaxID=2045452 RepID=UPI000C77D2C2|nr:alpha/beta fold hydrolase [Nocardioides houyundeii]
MTSAYEVSYVELHGHRRAYVMMGSGPALLLLHGLGCDHRTWLPVLESLATSYTVIAPDLLGHGASDKPRADYSLGGYANGMRDLLTVLGVEKVTVVGHSFGGGVAMQFAYQYPERTERIVLVASGGLGPEVTPVIRAITLPGFHQVMGALTLPGVRHASGTFLRLLSSTGLPRTRDLDEVAAVYESFADSRARTATRHVVRAVVDLKGQVVTMADRAYLTSQVPMCVVWGRDDHVIPVRHAANAGVLAPSARVEVLDDCGHFPHKDHPERFVQIVDDFMRTTPARPHSRSQWRRVLKAGAARPPLQVEAGRAPINPVAPVPHVRDTGA